MAGMLPGVECARRRRLHQSRDSTCTSGHGSSTRRSSFCLYTSNHESSLNSSSSLLRSNVSHAFMDDQKLGGVAREAKERLDGRLRAQWKSETKRKNSQESLKAMNVIPRSTVVSDLQTEVSELKKSGSKRFSWGKLGWKASDQDECAICLEQFSTGESLAHLRCAHRFHSRCLVPWLKSNAHCPCCRMGILCKFLSDF